MKKKTMVIYDQYPAFVPIKKPVVLIVAFMMCNVCLFAQTSFAKYHEQTKNVQIQKISVKAKNERLATVLDKIERQSHYVFVYSNDEINSMQLVSVDATNQEVNDVVDYIAKQINADFEIINDKIILRAKKTSERKSAMALDGAEREESRSFLSIPNEQAVTGRILNENNEGIAGASVSIKGTANGAITDAGGNFSLQVPDARTAVLVISFVGYEQQEVKLGGRTSITVTLARQDKALNEVVVVGYGTQRKVSVTGAVDQVGHQSIEGRPVTNLSTALQGTSPNLIIQQRNFEPGQPVNINIRGLGTLGDNSPLVVIDGIVGGDINLLNPNDIESVSILKDAGTAAIYGSRSANGVILITTKKGRKNERPQISYNGIYGIQSPHLTYEPVHAWENAIYKNESLINSGQQPAYTASQIQALKDRGDGDWRVSSILHNAPQQNHNISIRGGSATSTYLMSFGYLNQQNNFIGPDYGYQRYNIRLNQSTEIGRFKFNGILTYTKSMNKDHAASSDMLIVDAGRVPLLYSFQDSLGRYLTNGVSAQYNPKAILENGGYRQSNDDEIFGNLNGELSITKDLKIRGVFGGTVRSNSRFERNYHIQFYPSGEFGQDLPVADDNYKSLFTNTQLLAEYNKKFGEHEIRVLAGGSNESFKSQESYLRKTMTDPALGVPTTGTLIDPNSYNSNSGTTETSLNSLFGRVGYSYADRYFAEVNFRYDGSSNFPSYNRWGLFPSVSVAWRLSEEKFMSGFRDNIGDVKLRSSYGVLGNQNVRPYQYQGTFFNYTNAYGFNNVAVGGSGYNLANPQITWEKAGTFNVGTDIALFKNKLNVSLDYFDKDTKGILVRREDVPLLFGAQSADYNSAEVQNRGWEVKATYNHNGKIFHHSFTLNLADNLNTLKSFTFGANELVLPKEEFQIVRRVGYPITMYQGYKMDGFFQTQKDIDNAAIPAGVNRSSLSPGDIKFVDKNGDGVIDDKDKFILGNPFPRYTFGFTYSAAAKGFDLVLFIQGVGKRDQMIRGELVEPFHVGYSGTMYQHQTDYWTPMNPDAKYPRLAEPGTPSNVNNFRTGSNLFLFDAAYARLKNIQLGYSLPQSLINKAHLQKVRIYVTGQNLLTLTKLSFLDPEITEFDNNTGTGAGANSARAYPMPVFYGFGLDVNF